MELEVYFCLRDAEHKKFSKASLLIVMYVSPYDVLLPYSFQKITGKIIRALH